MIQMIEFYEDEICVPEERRTQKIQCVLTHSEWRPSRTLDSIRLSRCRSLSDCILLCFSLLSSEKRNGLVMSRGGSKNGRGGGRGMVLLVILCCLPDGESVCRLLSDWIFVKMVICDPSQIIINIWLNGDRNWSSHSISPSTDSLNKYNFIPLK